jgi:hypothetical protein
MPRQKFTDLTVANAKPSATGRLELWDAALPGFGLRITPNGVKTWVVMWAA